MPYVQKSDAETMVEESAADDALFTKITWRLLPFLMLCYLIAYLDRLNIGFAQLQMKRDLPFGDAAYAFGASVFFVGYLLLEVPSNMMMDRVGVRRTLLRIMVLWGFCASAVAFVDTPVQLYVCRFLLGAFEAGFFPGVMLYLTFWFPPARRGGATAIFMTSVTVAFLSAGPLSGSILKYADGVSGLYGWQWLFLLQGAPAVVLGLAAFFVLPDGPSEARWLSAAEKALLQRHLGRDAAAVGRASHHSASELLRDPKVYLFAASFGLSLGAAVTLGFWQPTLVRSWGVEDLFLVGILTGIPPIFGIVAMTFVGRHSDKHRERRWHYLACCCVAAVGLTITIFARGDIVASMLRLVVYYLGQPSLTPLCFAAISEYIPRKTAAAGLALVSSLGNIGPSVAPPTIVWVNAAAGTPAAGILCVAAMFVISGAVLATVLRRSGGSAR